MQQGIEAVIPARKGRTNPQTRNGTRRTTGSRLAQTRATRGHYDQYAHRFLGFLLLGGVDLAAILPQHNLANIRAGKIMLALIREYVTKGQSFAFDTTLSGRIFARRIPQWQAQGFWVKLCYLRLPSPETAIARVRLRVLEQGHHVPASIVRHRFHSGWYNFENVYRDLVDEWELYDNSGNLPILIDQGRAG